MHHDVVHLKVVQNTIFLLDSLGKIFTLESDGSCNALMYLDNPEKEVREINFIPN